MDRREAMLGTGLFALAGLAGADKASTEETPHVHHGLHHRPLADAAESCVATGQACLDHCLDLLGGGDKVQELHPIATPAAGRILDRCRPAAPDYGRSRRGMARRNRTR